MRPLVHLIAAFVTLGLVLIGCTQAPASPTPTASKASVAPASAPTAAPAVAPTTAPTKQAATVPAVAFPEKDKAITIILPFAAGGGSDLLVRAMAPQLEKDLGAPIPIVAKPGAATQLAMSELVKAKPDGYTVSIATLVTTAVTYLDPERKATYTGKDLTHVANLAVEDMVINVKSDSPWKNLRDITAAAKAAPNKIRIGTTGLMGIGHLAGLALQQEASVEFAYVHFEGSGPAATALLGGHVEATCTGGGAAFSQVKSGAVRVLGYLDDQQSSYFPDVPTITAQGYKLVMPAAYGLLAPPQTPPAIVDRISRAMKAALEDPSVKQRMADVAFTPRYMDPAQYASYWAASEKQAEPLIKLAKTQSQ